MGEKSRIWSWIWVHKIVLTGGLPPPRPPATFTGGLPAPQTPWQGAGSPPRPPAYREAPPLGLSVDLGTKILVTRSWYQDHGTKILVPRSWYQDSGTKILVSRSWYQEDLGTNKILVPVSVPRSGTKILARPGMARHGNIWHGTDHKGTARKYLAQHGSTGSWRGTAQDIPVLLP